MGRDPDPLSWFARPRIARPRWALRSERVGLADTRRGRISHSKKIFLDLLEKGIFFPKKKKRGFLFQVSVTFLEKGI